MPPKRISKAQREVMSKKQIVKNIREMAGLQRGQRPTQRRLGTPTEDWLPSWARTDHERQMELLDAKKYEREQVTRRLIQDLITPWQNEWARRIYNLDIDNQQSEMAGRLLDALTPMVDDFGRNITDEMKRDLDIILKEYFTSFDDSPGFLNELNTKDLGELVSDKIRRGIIGRARIQNDRRTLNPWEGFEEAGSLGSIMPMSMVNKLGETKSKALLKKVIEKGDGGAANPNTGFKKMKGKAFLKSDDPLAAKALREITEAFEKKGSKLSREEKNAILDPYLSGEVGQAPAKPTKMSRPSPYPWAQVVRPMTTSGSIYERVKELQRAKRTASAVASQVAEAAGRAGVKAEAAEKQAAKTAANRRAEAAAAAAIEEQAEELASMKVDLDAMFESDEEDSDED